MAAANEADDADKFYKWGLIDAARETRRLKHNPRKAAGRFKFSTPNQKREIPKSSCSLEEFALTKHVMNLVSRPNAATYLMENFDYNSVCTDFKKFITFVETYPEPGKSELAALIFPIFVHFFLLMMHSGGYGQTGPQLARKFFNRNKNVFDFAPSYECILERLYSLKNARHIRADPYYKYFLTHKYIIGMSEDVLQALQEFVENDSGEPGEKSLLYVLHFRIYFQDNDEIEVTGSDNVDTKLDFLENVMLDDTLSDSSGNSVLGDINAEFHESMMLENSKAEPPLEDLLKELNVMHPRISTIVTKCEMDELFSLDFNDDETEIAYALGDDYIYVAPIEIDKKQTKRQIVECSGSAAAMKKQRFEEENMEVVLVPHSSSLKKVGPKKKGAKGSKGKKGKGRKGKKKKVKFADTVVDDAKIIDTDKRPHPVSGMKEVKAPGTREKVYIVKYLPGKPHYLLAVCNMTVRLFNTETSSFESEYTGDHTFIFDVDVNLTSQFFATANDSMESCLYDFNQSSAVRKFLGHDDVVTSVKFHPNGLYVATGSDDKKIRLFDIESGLCCRSFVGHIFGVWTLAFTSNGRLLASGDSSGVVKSWDVATGREISEVCFSKVKETLARITSLCFHSDNRVLAACNRKGEMKLWDVKNPDFLMVLNFTNIPLKIKFRKNGRWKIAFRNHM